MPSLLASSNDPEYNLVAHNTNAHPYYHNQRSDKTTALAEELPGGWPTNGVGGQYGMDGSVVSLVNGTNGRTECVKDKGPRQNRGTPSMGSQRSLALENDRVSGDMSVVGQKQATVAEGHSATPNGKPTGSKTASFKPTVPSTSDAVSTVSQRSAMHSTPAAPFSGPPLAAVRGAIGAPPLATNTTDSKLKVPISAHRASSPPAFSHGGPTSTAPSSSSPPQAPPNRLIHRHTLEVPRVVSSRLSKDGSIHSQVAAEDAMVLATGRFSPNTPTRRRGSVTLAKRHTHSINSDMHLDDIAQDEDAARWTEHIRLKRASKRRREPEIDDDRVVVGTKVDQNHVNFVTAYNMLTGIRFTVSRTNAKIDRELTEADFQARHKFSFDITGNELTPSAKYDFKFKDYAPWVFRHLRANFRLDPADYLVSLTSKYILSELGSPGKSGSFFYFSRDYKYIIKTIHHAEHKFLRKILREYYDHVTADPDTLLSQFYGLHRVKIPYGRKIHFVVMNNLFPPHRDIHHTFDLKGSTIGRNFKEEDLAKNPRATLKDLNWLHRDLHLEFGPTKREAFVAQMKRDVALLQKLQIMDYSLLVGIHDLERGNEENLRDKTLQVFQPGGDKAEEQPRPNMLMRTPSKLESARKAKELRQLIRSEKPIPMDQTMTKMPDVMLKESRKDFYFYSDDGGFRATHEDDRPGDEVYYLGIIDCLTHYGLIKRTEHFWKGFKYPESQISAIPPERYGDRFIRFISGIIKTRERVEAEKARHSAASEQRTETAIERAERNRQRGANENGGPDRSISAVKSPDREGAGDIITLPVIGEAVESGSAKSRTPSRVTPQPSNEDLTYEGGGIEREPARDGFPIVGTAIMTSESVGNVPPPTPPKTMRDFGDTPPPTPLKDGRGRGLNKELPPHPRLSTQFSASPARAKSAEMEELRLRIRDLSS
ncbi:Phosphatidylinositol-4-phosphate 5-kinase [Elasticomyces elasticus]|nr:Phosphatidylinositol-4-phosphate 5-kinase [Elasticomyces elasticus]